MNRFIKYGGLSLVMASLFVGNGVAAETREERKARKQVEKEQREAEKAQREAERLAAVDAILSRDPQADDYVEDTRCLQSARIRNIEVLDDKHVAIQMRRDEFFLVQFQRRCPGMRRGRPVMHEGRENKICRLDSLRSMHHNGFGGLEPGMRCAIPGFQSISKEQLMHLKDLLKAEKRRKKKKTA